MNKVLKMGRPPNGPRGMWRLVAVGVAVLVMAGVGAPSPGRAAPLPDASDTGRQQQFVIGTFFDPPTTSIPARDHEAFEIARDAYFNLLTGFGSSSHGSVFTLEQMLYRLSLATEVGLSTLVGDRRFLSRVQACLRRGDFCPAFDLNDATAVTDDYTSVPAEQRRALYGYYIADEPCGAGIRPDIASCDDEPELIKQWIEHFRTRDPDKLAYVNLLSAQGETRKPLSDDARETFRAYLDTYLSEADPGRSLDVASFDRYPFNCDGPLFVDQDHFCNLRTLREKAAGRPFWAHVLSTSTGTICDPDAAQLRFMAFSPIAYGARGLVYFTYSRPSDEFGEALVDAAGQPTAKYETAQAINRYISRILGPIVMQSPFIRAIHASTDPTGEDLSDDELALPFTSSSLTIVKLAPQSVFVGMFEDEASSRITYGLVVNKSLSPVNDAQITVPEPYRRLVFLSPRFITYDENDHARFHPTEVSYDFSLDSGTLDLGPLEGGEARLFRVGPPVSAPALVQTSFGDLGNFELVAADPRGGIVHLFRDNDTDGNPWIPTEPPFGQQLGLVDDVTMIQSNFTTGGGKGNLEVIARVGNELFAFWRGDTAETLTWNGPFRISNENGVVQDVAGNLVLIQSSFGDQGNFEVIYPSSNGGIAPLFRDNDASDPAWRRAAPFGQQLGLVDDVTMIQSNFTTGGGEGNLEVIARVGNELFAFWRGDTAETLAWNGPFRVSDDTVAVGDVAGAPVLIQSSFGDQGNFEVIYPSSNGGIVHLFRDNDAGDPAWHRTGLPFAQHLDNVDGVSLIQSTIAAPSAEGNLEVVARNGLSLHGFWRSPDGTWRENPMLPSQTWPTRIT